MERNNNQYFTSNLVCKDSNKKVWQIYDSVSQSYGMFTVRTGGEVYFEINNNKFPYSDALMHLVKLEGRKLSMTLYKNQKKYINVINNVKDCTKVPCDGVSFQIYYLNP